MNHPAPMFAPSPAVPETVVPVAEPVSVVPAPAPQRVAEPVVQPEVLPAIQPVTSETTGSLAPTVPDEPVGNAQVFEVQKKLLELDLFEGDVDGYYGPMTARAIRAFEERNGLEPLGALTPQIVDAILKADADGRMPAVAAAVVRETAPAQAAPQPDILIGRVEERVTIESIVDSAAETIDSIVGELAQGRQTPAQPNVAPRPALPLQAVTTRQEMPPPVAQTAAAPAVTQPPAAVEQPIQTASVAAKDTAVPGPPASNTELVRQVQRGLASLGFLHGAIDGEANAATARAIRNFEVYHNYEVTGRVTPTLVDMLIAAGASV
jgi:peptidoglycan hydrolase-like protein with peptidoglycan-binding domain